VSLITELPRTDKPETARLILNIGFVVALLPLVLAGGAYLLFKAGALSWQTTYGTVLVGDGGLSLALQASVAAVITTLAGVGATLWAAPKDLYARSMLNIAITGFGLAILLAVRG